MKFWDASAIIPLCLEEPWTLWLSQVLAEDTLMIVWWGSMVECWSAFARLRREGLFQTRDEEDARTLLARLATAWTEVLPSQAVRDHAAHALQWHPLRAADGLQLAAALVWVQGQPSGQPFVCLDHRLRAAAQREGFLLIPSSESLQAPTISQRFIAVGRSVTRPPPHRSRRAVFSHRALQKYSLPQIGLGPEGCLSRLWSSNDPWSGHFEALQHSLVALPRVTGALATPMEPLQQNPYGFVEALELFLNRKEPSSTAQHRHQ